LSPLGPITTAASFCLHPVAELAVDDLVKDLFGRRRIVPVVADADVGVGSIKGAWEPDPTGSP